MPRLGFALCIVISYVRPGGLRSCPTPKKQFGQPMESSVFNKLSVCIIPILFFGSITSALAGEADVLAVDLSPDGKGWRFSVTVEHADEGWDHYADKFDIIGPDGTVYGTRILHHPHVEEQPFTRSLGGVKIPDEVDEVIVRAHDSVHGYGGKTITTDLPQ